MKLKNSLVTLKISHVPSVTTPPSLILRLPSWSIEGGSGNETTTPPRCSDMGVTFVFHLGVYFGSKMFMAVSSTPSLSDFSSHKGSWSLETHRWPHAHQRGATDQWPGSCPPGSKVLLPVHTAGGGGEVVRPPLRPSDIKVRTKLCLMLRPTFRPLCFYLLPFLLPSLPFSLPSLCPPLSLPPLLLSLSPRLAVEAMRALHPGVVTMALNNALWSQEEEYTLAKIPSVSTITYWNRTLHSCDSFLVLWTRLT